MSAHILVSAVGWIAGAVRDTKVRPGSEGRSFVPLSTEAMLEDQYCARSDHNDHYQFSSPYRQSDDSGQGTEPNTESLRSSSSSSVGGIDEIPPHSLQKEFEEEEDDLEAMPLSSQSRKSVLVTQAAKLVNFRIWRYLDIGYRVVNRIILPFGFIALTTGVVTFGRFFVS